MSRIIDFYNGTGTDDQGRTIYDVLSFNDAQFERTHDYIQWLFPLPESSQAQPSSPVATADDYEALKANPEMLNLLKQAAGLLDRFYRQTMHWRRPRDHNHLRITRILRCLTLCDLWVQAEAFKQARMAEVPNLSEVTKQFWEDALEYEPPWRK